MFFFWLSVNDEKENRIQFLQQQGFNLELFNNKQRLLQRVDAIEPTPTLIFLNTSAVNTAIEICQHLRAHTMDWVDVILCPEFIGSEDRERFIAEGGLEVMCEPVGRMELTKRIKRWSAEQHSKTLFDREMANAGQMTMLAMESGAETGVALNFCRRVLANSSHEAIADACLDIIAGHRKACCIEMFDGTDTRYYGTGDWQDEAKNALKAARKQGRVLFNQDLQINQSHIAVRIFQLTPDAVLKFQDGTDNFLILLDLANQFVLQANHVFKHAQLEEHHNGFLENVGSELQTRLSVMLKFASAMHKLEVGQTLSDKNIQGLKSTYINSVRLKKIIDAMSDLIQVSSGMEESNYQDIYIPTLLNQLKETHAPTALAQSNTHIVVGKVADTSVKTSDEYLRRILSYLIDRSIECTKNGKISLHCICKELPEKTLTILQITDTGTHLSELQIAKIMGTLKHVIDDPNDKFDINMVYVRTFSALLGGKLYIVSDAAKGTTFTISFIHDNTPEPEVTETNSSGIDFF